MWRIDRLVDEPHLKSAEWSSPTGSPHCLLLIIRPAHTQVDCLVISGWLASCLDTQRFPSRLVSFPFSFGQHNGAARPGFIIMLALPLELVYQICDWLMHDDVQALALTCRTIARRTKTLRFPSIRVKDLDLTLLYTLQSDPEMASAVREVILDLPAEFDPYAPMVPDEMLSTCRRQCHYNLSMPTTC